MAKAKDIIALLKIRAEEGLKDVEEAKKLIELAKKLKIDVLEEERELAAVEDELKEILRAIEETE